MAKRKNGTKIALIVIWCVVTLVIALGVTWLKIVYSGNDLGLDAPIEVDAFYSEWQSYIDDNAKINQIAMAGSHDAGSAGLMPLAETQCHSIYDQLISGVRYFDLRATEKNGELLIFHSICEGQSLKTVIDDINRFVTEHPSEFLILDFQHIGDKSHAQVMQFIEENLDMSKAMKKSVHGDLADVTMYDVRHETAKANYVVVWTDTAESADKDDFYARKLYLNSPYTTVYHQAKTSAELIEHFETYFNSVNGRDIFVLQLQRTSANLLFIKPSVNELEFKDDFNKYIASLATDPEKLAKTNVIMRDFVASDINNIKAILRLNIAKGNVKADKLAEYTAKLA